MKGRIDLNCDLGESFGRYRLGDDERLLPWITSANIACGYHAGDPEVMGRTVALAKSAGVAIGAHPSLPDLVGFGRRKINVTASEAYHMIVYQIGALKAFAEVHQVPLQHVKPHGALYHMAAQNESIALAVTRAICDVDKNLILFALAGSRLVEIGRKHGLLVAEEVFADRTYQQDGSLTPRHHPAAVITDLAKAVEQVLTMVTEGMVVTLDGSKRPIHADTLCLHGDHPEAVTFVKALRQRLQAAGIEIKPVGEIK